MQKIRNYLDKCFKAGYVKNYETRCRALVAIRFKGYMAVSLFSGSDAVYICFNLHRLDDYICMISFFIKCISCYRTQSYFPRCMQC